MSGHLYNLYSTIPAIYLYLFWIIDLSFSYRMEIFYLTMKSLRGTLNNGHSSYLFMNGCDLRIKYRGCLDRPNRD